MPPRRCACTSTSWPRCCRGRAVRGSCIVIGVGVGVGAGADHVRLAAAVLLVEARRADAEFGADDNYQELPGDSPLHAAIAKALGELPPGAQWIFISREPPPPPLPMRLARQRLGQLDAEALRFSAEETLAMTRLHGRPNAMARALDVAEG